MPRCATAGVAYTLTALQALQLSGVQIGCLDAQHDSSVPIESPLGLHTPSAVCLTGLTPAHILRRNWAHPRPHSAPELGSPPPTICTGLCCNLDATPRSKALACVMHAATLGPSSSEVRFGCAHLRMRTNRICARPNATLLIAATPMWQRPLPFEFILSGAPLRLLRGPVGYICRPIASNAARRRLGPMANRTGLTPATSTLRLGLAATTFARDSAAQLQTHPNCVQQHRAQRRRRSVCVCVCACACVCHFARNYWGSLRRCRQYTGTSPGGSHRRAWRAAASSP